MKKHWSDYRVEEMEEKAGVILTNIDYPEFDMDGSRFYPYVEDWETEQRSDAYIYSISRRLMEFEKI